MNKKELLECLQYLHKKVTCIVPKDVEVSLTTAIDAVQKDVEAEEKDEDGYKFEIGETVLINYRMRGCTGKVVSRLKGTKTNIYSLDTEACCYEEMLRKL